MLAKMYSGLRYVHVMRRLFGCYWSIYEEFRDI